MLSQLRRFLLDTPLTLIHLVGGTGAAVLAFLLTLNGHGIWVAFPVMFAALMPDSLYSVSMIQEWRDDRLPLAMLLLKLKQAWALMACVCVAVLFTAWLGTQWAIVNAAFTVN